MSIRRKVDLTSGELFFHENLPIYVNRVSESFTLSEHSHDFSEICLVAEGRGFHYINGETVTVSSGDLFFIPIGTTHVFRPSSTRQDDALVVFNCIFQPDKLSLLRQYPIEPEVMKWFAGDPLAQKGWLYLRERYGEFQFILQKMYNEYVRKQPGHQAQLLASLLELLVLIHRHQTSDSTDVVSAQSTERVGTMKQFIANNFHQAMTVDDITSAANISIRQGQRLFRQACGMTITEYIQQVRVARAKQILSRPQTTILEAAHDCGYEDLKYFTGIFKKWTGVTPSQFRSLQQKV